MAAIIVGLIVTEFENRKKGGISASGSNQHAARRKNPTFYEDEPRYVTRAQRRREAEKRKKMKMLAESGTTITIHLQIKTEMSTRWTMIIIAMSAMRSMRNRRCEHRSDIRAERE